jgi:hypothetical protein
MKLVQGLAQPKPLNEIKNALTTEFKKPNLDSKCITKMKEINQNVAEPVWEFYQRFKTLTCLVVEPDYLPDSEVLAFSRVYTP